MEETKAVTKLDEVELYLGLAKIDYPELIDNRTYKQIADALNKKYNIFTTEEDVFLLHEPTIEELEEDLRTHFHALNLVY